METAYAKATDHKLHIEKNTLHVGTAVLEFPTTEKVQIIDITDCINKAIGDLKMCTGLVGITTQHTTASILVQEPESNLFRDIMDYLVKLVPKGNYNHDDLTKRVGCPANEPLNAESHLKAMLLGSSVSWPYDKGKLTLGTYQSVLFVEFDGPCPREEKNQKRKVFMRMIGD